MDKICIPHLRRVGKGHIIWISSSSAHGGVPPLFGPYFAAKAATGSLAVTYATELAPWRIKTTVMVPGVFMKGTNHFANAGKPEDGIVGAEYLDGPLQGVPEQTLRGVEKDMQQNTDPVVIAEAIVKVVQALEGKKPFRVHVDSFGDGSEEVNGLSDRRREELFDRLELDGLLKRDN